MSVSSPCLVIVRIFSVCPLSVFCPDSLSGVCPDSVYLDSVKCPDSVRNLRKTAVCLSVRLDTDETELSGLSLSLSADVCTYNPPSARTTLTVPTFFNGSVVTRLHLRQVGGFNLGIPILTSIILPLMYLTLKFLSPIFSVWCSLSSISWKLKLFSNYFHQSVGAKCPIISINKQFFVKPGIGSN